MKIKTEYMNLCRYAAGLSTLIRRMFTWVIALNSYRSNLPGQSLNPSYPEHDSGSSRPLPLSRHYLCWRGRPCSPCILSLRWIPWRGPDGAPQTARKTATEKSKDDSICSTWKIWKPWLKCINFYSQNGWFGNNQRQFIS